MKLYFYILDPWANEPEVIFTECEVHEKPKTYAPALDGFPAGFHGAYVRKEDIGKAIDWNKNVVVLTEPNVETAKKVLSNVFENEIERLRKKIAELERKVRSVNSFESEV